MKVTEKRPDFQTANLLPVFQEPDWESEPEPVVVRGAVPPRKAAPRRKEPPRSSVSDGGKAITDFLKWHRSEGYKHKFRERKPNYPTF